MDLKYCIILTRKLLQKLLQKNKLFIFIFGFVLSCLLPKKLKASQCSGLKRLCKFVNKDYYYYYYIYVYITYS